MVCPGTEGSQPWHKHLSISRRSWIDFVLRSARRRWGPGSFEGVRSAGVWFGQKLYGIEIWWNDLIDIDRMWYISIYWCGQVWDLSYSNVHNSIKEASHRYNKHWYDYINIFLEWLISKRHTHDPTPLDAFSIELIAKLCLCVTRGLWGPGWTTKRSWDLGFRWSWAVGITASCLNGCVGTRMWEWPVTSQSWDKNRHRNDLYF